MSNDRRRFLAAGAAIGVGALAILDARSLGQDKPKEQKKDKPEEDVGAAEDLMREHGVLNRILLIYEEGLRRLRDKEDLSPDVFLKPATLVHKFVEDYHENLEECFIFPEFEKRMKLTELTKLLREQHKAGRNVTDIVLRNAAPDSFRKEESRKELVAACQAFIRMYRPHEAREDTVLFPALHKILTVKQLDALGDRFEEEENKLFGKEGFEKTVEQVALVEKQLGIEDLAKFTPK